MTQEQAHLFLPLIKAWSEGKTLQVRDPDIVDKWYDFSEQESVRFDDSPDHYRIKPESKFRPWKPEEVPVGAVVRYKDREGYEGFVYLIIAAYTDKFFMGDMGRSATYLWAITHVEYSTDGGKTWSPCGVLEVEGEA